MVVASIIILIVSIVITNLDVSKKKGRDTKKINELKSVQTAIELYRFDSPYPASVQGGFLNGAINDVVDARFLSGVPTPPQGSSIAGDAYYYQTNDDDGPIVPACNGKRLGEVPYIIYFTTELPHNLPVLTKRNSASDAFELVEVNGYSYGYCLTL